MVVATASDEQFRALAGGGSDIAAATVGQRIVFAPGAAAMSDSALRIVLRHELFHYAARAEDRSGRAALAHRGRRRLRRQAGRRRGPARQRAAELAQLPSDADLDTAGATRSLAYDRAWWFSRFVADRYGTPTPAQAVRDGPAAPATQTSRRPCPRRLGADLGEVLAEWRRWLCRIA